MARASRMASLMGTDLMVTDLMAIVPMETGLTEMDLMEMDLTEMVLMDPTASLEATLEVPDLTEPSQAAPVELAALANTEVTVETIIWRTMPPSLLLPELASSREALLPSSWQ